MFYFGKVLFTAFIVATSTSAHVRGTETDGSSTNQALTDDTEVTTTQQTGELDTVQPVTDNVEDEEERSLSWSNKLGFYLKLKWNAATKPIDDIRINRVDEKVKQLRDMKLEKEKQLIAMKLEKEKQLIGMKSEEQAKHLMGMELEEKEKETQLIGMKLDEKARKIAHKRHRLLVKHNFDPNSYHERLVELNGGGMHSGLATKADKLDYLDFSEYWRKKT
uniref:RxLR effector candidate protein n=1 Tax=Hyaloperonospora arabidopsidis (strain Emoy2) TaxID=559515 RepID=M4C161_HYAAE